jgi:hypothetical protein
VGQVLCWAALWATKPSAALLAIPLARQLGLKLLVASFGVAGALCLAFLLWGPAEFWRGPVLYQLNSPMRLDGLTVTALLHNLTGHDLPTVVMAGATLALVAASFRRSEVGWAGSLGAAGAAQTGFFIFNKWGFANYYYLAGGMLWMAAAAAMGEAALWLRDSLVPEVLRPPSTAAATTAHLALPRIMVVMPAYHAARTLEATVAALPPDFPHERLLVDDASQDDTATLARSLGLTTLEHIRNFGYGANQKTCYNAALERGAEIVVMLHPDFQYEPASVPKLVAPLVAGEADIAFGSRFAEGADPRHGGMPSYRYWGNRLTTWWENLCLGSSFTELHSGMRAYRRAALLRLPYNDYADDFVFDSQLIIDAVRLGMRVSEVPIPTRYTTESSSTSIPASLRYVGVTAWLAAKAALARSLGRWPQRLAQEQPAS